MRLGELVNQMPKSNPTPKLDFRYRHQCVGREVCFHLALVESGAEANKKKEGLDPDLILNFYRAPLITNHCRPHRGDVWFLKTRTLDFLFVYFLVSACLTSVPSVSACDPSVQPRLPPYSSLFRSQLPALVFLLFDFASKPLKLSSMSMSAVWGLAFGNRLLKKRNCQYLKNEMIITSFS